MCHRRYIDAINDRKAPKRKETNTEEILES